MENLELKKTFGSILREARERTGLSQEKFALRAGLDRTTISMLERGIHQPTLSTIFALAKNWEIKAATLVARLEATCSKSE